MVKYISTIVLLIWSNYCAELNVVHLKTNKNIDVFLHKYTSAKSVSIHVVYFDAGETHYNPGIASLLCSCFEKCDASVEGTEVSSWDIKKENRFSFDSSFARDNFFVDFTFLKEQLPMFSKFAKARLFSLKFDDFENIKQGCATEVKTNLMSENGTLAKETKKIMFPKHPYGIVATDKDVEQKTLQEVKDAYKDLLTKHNFSVVVSGNLTEDEAKSMVDDIFGQCVNNAADKSVAKKEKIIPDVNVTVLTKDHLIDYNNAPFKTSRKYLLAYMPYKRVKKDLPKQIACELILNRFMRSFMDSDTLLYFLRNEGLVYVIDATILKNKHSSYILLSTQTNKFAETKKKILDYWKNLVKKGISKNQLDDYKEYLKSVILTGLITPSGYASLIMSKLVSGIEENQILATLEALDKIDQPFFNNFLKTQIKPEQMSFVVLFK